MFPTWDRRTVPAVADAMLARLEGCKLAAHWDSLSRQFDIGYGSLRMPNGAKVKVGDRISQAQADAMLDADCAQWVRDITAAITVPLTEAQAAALISFAHNIGGAAFAADSTFVRMANAGRIDLMAGQMIGWSHSGGQLVLGLLHRNEYQRRICMGECQDSLAAYEAVWALSEADLMPLYNAAYAQAAQWGYSGGVAVKGPAVPLPSRTKASPAAPAADDSTEDLNNASLAAAQQGA